MMAKMDDLNAMEQLSLRSCNGGLRYPESFQASDNSNYRHLDFGRFSG